MRQTRQAASHPRMAFMPKPEGLRCMGWLTALAIDPKETGVSHQDIRLMLLE